ncbi:MAG: MMPL family transporter, partial [Thaumarchaeota archaeon]|nr:MMPL family transporter [Nitrososphaerota archaeon]
MATSRPNAFARLGSVIVKRKYFVIVLWVVILLIALPATINAAKSTSLQQGTASGTSLESVQASNIISAQFPSSVPNSSLLVVVSGNNVSSPQVQQFIAGVVSEIRSNETIHGLQNATTVYSVLYSLINGTNGGVFGSYDAANKTSNLIYGVPAFYLGAWEGAYNATHSVEQANAMAYHTVASNLSASNVTAYNLYSSHVLDYFNASWSASFQNPALQNYSVIERATYAANISSLDYVDNYMESSHDFGTGLVNSLTLGDFLTYSKTNLNSTYANFAVKYISNESGFSAEFVNATYSIGRHYDNASLDRLAGNIVWNPNLYQPGNEIKSLIASFVSPTRNTTLISLGLNQSSDSNLLAIRSTMHSALSTGHYPQISSALVTGSDAINYDFSGSTQNDLAVILPVTIILLIVATGLFFRSVFTPFMTLGTIGLALGIAESFIVIVSTFVSKVDFTIPTILDTILIGVGTDYSVFIIARFREERVKGLNVGDAIVKSITWAGESIATSGATVIISFLSLSFTTIVYLRTMGLIVGLGVLVALSVALTLVPAILAIAGGRTFWPNSGKRFANYAASVIAKLEKKTGYFSRSGKFSVKHAKVLILVAVLVTLPALYVYLNTVPTYDFLAGAPANLESVAASNHLTSAFGGGRVNPTYVVVTFSQPLWNGSRFDTSEMGLLQNMSTYLASNRDNRTIASILQNVGKDNKTALITINFKIDPYSTQAINDAQTMRTYLHQNFNSTGVTGIYLGGAAGGILDTRNEVGGQFNSVLPIVAIGVALVLLIVLGSLFLPLFAVVSVLMSIVWTLALTKIVFQTFFNYGLLFITPLFLFVTLLGLGMDYNIFILTRIREEAAKGQKLNDAIVHAIEQTGGIITAAAP